MAKKKEKELDLADILAGELNKQSKDQKVAFFLNDDEAPTNVDGWVSTGCAMLDVAISNRPYGGLPVGRITEITGLEQSGKSLVSAHLLAETQKQGGVAVLIDTETAVSRDFLEAIGVDVSKLLYVTADSVEQIFDMTETIIEKVRETSKDKLVTIVVDSVAAASTTNELASDYKKDGYATDKAIIISKAMRKITNMIGRQKISLVFTNQLRQKMNAMFGDPWTTSGGKALAFHASVRLRLKNMGQIKMKQGGQERTVGMKVRCQVVKNRMGPPLRAADFEIYFDRGIDNYGSWLKVMKENNLVKQAGAWYTYVDTETGEEIKFQSKDFIEMMGEKEVLREQIYKKICEETILQYKGDTLDIDNMEIDTKGPGVGD
jgi:recombination protein RecA|tara:strand:+ start:2264 stop:3391 length:1128 start_codon:yes stop_codon:yes gene_type:complete